MGAKSRRKGAVAEREVAALAREMGFAEAERAAPLQAGINQRDEADVRSVGRLWIESKRYRRTPVNRFAREVLSEERPGFVSVLVYRDDRQPEPYAVLTLRELLKLERDAFGPQRNNPCAFCGSLLIGTTRIEAKALPVPQEPSSCCGGGEGGGCCSSNAPAGAGCAGGKCGGKP